MNRFVVKLGLLALVVAVSRGVMSGSPARSLENKGEQRGFMVWDAGCIRSISKGLNTKMEAPLVDGEPDMKNVEIFGTVVDYDHKCGRIEVRRVKYGER